MAADAADRELARQALLRAKESSQREIDAIYAAQPLRVEFLRERLTDFVLAKFLLTREEAEGVDFQKLSQLNLAKSMKISKELVKEFDMAQGCAGTSSEIAKKTLLFLALQKQLKLELPARALPRIHSFQELAELVLEAMRASEFWRDRL
jgi:hypothetical protein